MTEGMSSRGNKGFHRGKGPSLSGWAALAVLLALLAWSGPAVAVDRFPRPDFQQFQMPEVSKPGPLALVWEYIDVIYLAAALALATWLALVRRSRKGLFVLAMVSLAWLGFWRKGCVCSIGAIQNVALAVADPSYVLPLSVVAIFLLPLLATLFFGRTFCASVCPLGAVQELVVLKPLRVPLWLEHALGLVPYLYLGAAVVFAATGTMFLICQYDPFVGFFRLSAPATMLVYGACFLLIGVFVGRPYCRFLCPYGALLGLLSKASKRHVRIPPEECINCRLCEDACPYNAIQPPTVPLSPQERTRGRRRLALLLAASPLLVGLGVYLGGRLAVPLAAAHPVVRLAEDVRQTEIEKSSVAEEPTDDAAAAAAEELKRRNDAVEAFANTRRPARELYLQAVDLRDRFAVAGAWLGGWVGLVLAVKLIALSIRRRRTEYLPDQANCVSCGRCFWYCPKEQLRLGLIQEIPADLTRPVSGVADGQG